MRSQKKAAELSDINFYPSRPDTGQSVRSNFSSASGVLELNRNSPSKINKETLR